VVVASGGASIDTRAAIAHDRGVAGVADVGAEIFRVLVPVSDIEAAQAFHARLLDDPGRRVSPGRRDFDCGGTILVCFFATDPFGNALGFVRRGTVFRR